MGTFVWAIVGLFLLQLSHGVSGSVVVKNSENATFSFADADAAFGGVIPSSGLRGVLQLADPVDGCAALQPPADAAAHNAAFALVQRGNCMFDVKVRNAQVAGYKAVVVYNNEIGRDLITMSGRSIEGLFIPAVFVTSSSGRQLRSAIRGGDTVCFLFPSFESTAWSVMAVSFISILAVAAVLMTFFFVRRHRLRRVGSRLLLLREPLGMAARDVKALPCFTFSTAGGGGGGNDGGGGTSETCAICLEDYEDGDKLRVLPCRHEFHAPCVDHWLTTRRPFCPVCKRNASDAAGGPTASERTPLLSSRSGANPDPGPPPTAHPPPPPGPAAASDSATSAEGRPRSPRGAASDRAAVASGPPAPGALAAAPQPGDFTSVDMPSVTGPVAGDTSDALNC